MPVPLFMPVEMPREGTRQMPYFAPPMYYRDSGRKYSECRSTFSRSSRRCDSSHSSHSQQLTRSPSRRNSGHAYLLPSITTSSPVVDVEEGDGHHGISITDDVLSEYMQPSPLPPDCLLPVPQMLHVRKEATGLLKVDKFVRCCSEYSAETSQYMNDHTDSRNGDLNRSQRAVNHLST
ncbi:uncharacterized protein BT62DRAFT_541122 [Guyanagaster necrorhizus]|uniref:Uncharacterized protein n=1 Tax=Guyanagaster necrorhizus TaxID=856835 RepID=A0A9P7W1W5_9AGAR|nr:uncharacterized protein BT62DRAFT_541122 [Guyanagaster necrorhizus MCA 3950]KAG7450865.1 hypothetical protein BT62DRAFT_541122 [Guyanagaster necrorhizus MCA 3950]